MEQEGCTMYGWRGGGVEREAKVRVGERKDTGGGEGRRGGNIGGRGEVEEVGMERVEGTAIVFVQTPGRLGRSLNISDSRESGQRAGLPGQIITTAPI